MRRLLISLTLLGVLCAGTALCGHRASSRSAAAHKGPVHIEALAREDHQERANDSAASARSAVASGARQDPWSMALLSLGLVLIAAAGTAIVVSLMHRRALCIPADAGPPEEEPGEEAAPEKVADFAPALKPAPLEPAGGLPETPVEPSEESLEERAAVLAQRMERGRGEMDLALRLEATTDENAGAALQRLCTGVTSNAQRVRTAKRFGVGRGEVDLAVRLKALASHAYEKEPTL